MTDTLVEIKHGTYAGWNAHKRRGIPMCQPCRDAAAAYKKRWLDAAKGRREKDREFTKAQSRALWRLAAIHPREFRALVADELRAAKQPEAS
jgi:hypothetical protein